MKQHINWGVIAGNRGWGYTMVGMIVWKIIFQSSRVWNEMVGFDI